MASRTPRLTYSNHAYAARSDVRSDSRRHADDQRIRRRDVGQTLAEFFRVVSITNVQDSQSLKGRLLVRQTDQFFNGTPEGAHAAPRFDFTVVDFQHRLDLQQRAESCRCPAHPPT